MASKVSIKTVLNTPQAVNDSFAGLEDLVSYLDVLANDGGGNAASLYALMGTGLTAGQIATALQSPVRTDYQTSLGAKASIITTGEHAGTISYDASALDYLAEGQVATDTFSYVIQLGNGTFSIATVTVTVTGTNDRPVADHVIVGAAAGIVEDGLAYRGSFDADDIDSDDDVASLTYQILSQPGEGSVTIDPDNSAGFIFDPGADFQDLEEGETRTVTFTYQAVDRHGSVSEPATVSITVTGQADDTDGALIDGYIANALIFRDSNTNSVWDHESFTDANNNGIFDDGEVYVDADGNNAFTAEFFTVTDLQGNFEGLGGTGRIVAAPLTGAIVTTDISTGEAWTGLYSAPEGSTVVTPLTTVLDSMAGPGATEQEIADAQALLAAALGIDPAVDIISYDPIAAVVGETDPAALALAVEVQKIAVQVANIIAVIDETLQAAGVDDGGALAAAALAAEIETSGGTTDLTSAALIQTVIEEAAAGTPAQTAVEEQSAAIAEALSGINEVIDAVDETGDPLGALAEVVAAQFVAQENLAADAAAAVGGGDPVDTTAYEGTNLVEQLDLAANEVETIIPDGNPPSLLGAPGRPSVDDGIRINSAEIGDGIVVTVPYDSSLGVAAGDKLNLLLGGAIIATYTLTTADIQASGALVQAFVVAQGTLGADGAKVLTAQFETQLGQTGPASPPALVTVDTSAPGAPAAIAAVEGTIITAVEAADGTQFTGTVDAGSIVTFTFQNGAQTLAKEAAVTDTNFTLTLTEAEVAFLGEGYVSYSAIASDAAGNQSGPSASGQFFYTTLPVVDGTNRVDGAGSYFAGDLDDEYIDVTALPGGGFSVAWLTDADEDGDGEGFAVQNYLADGSKDGAVVVLQGLSSNLTQLGDLVSSYDLTTLDDGSYVLAYAVEREEITTVLTLNASPGGQFVTPIIGEPQSFQVVNYTTAANGLPPKVFLSGTGNNGLPLNNVELALVDGEYRVTQQILDLFLIDNRFQVTVNNLAASTSATLVRLVEEDVIFDNEAPLATEVLTRVIPSVNPGAGVAFFNAARAEYFHIDSRLDSANQPITTALPNGIFQINPSVTGSISIAGIANATIRVDGVIQITGIVPDADGNYHVPPAILSQLGTHDAAINLILINQPFGSTWTATAYKTAPISVPEGVFVQTFDADGSAASAGDVAISSLPYMASDDGNIPLDTSTLSDGGFAVHWLTDIDGDREGDTMAVQRFDANGAAVGSTVLLQDLASNLLNNGDNVQHLDVAALDDGGFALTYSLERDTGSKAMNFVANPTGVSNVGIGGVPTVIYIGQAPANAQFRLTGLDELGNQITSELLPVIDGQIAITQELINAFPFPNRVALQVAGLTTGQTANLFVEIEQSVRYNTLSGLSSEGLSGNVIASPALPGLNIGVLTYSEGRVEGIHFAAPVTFTSSVGIPKQFQLILNTSFDPNTINLAGVVGTGGVTAANINPQGQIVLTFTNLTQTDFAVPASILSQIGERDYGALMLVLGLPTGPTTISATADIRAGIAIPEGVFVQTFNADGSPSSTGNTRIDGDGSWLPQSEDEDHLDIAPTADGGFAVNWLADIDDDGEADSPAIQRFDASGNAVGGVVVLDPLPSYIQTEYISGFEVGALADGTYVASYAIEREATTKVLTINGNPVNSTTNVSFGGVPSTITVAQSVGALGYTLNGLDEQGNAVVLPVFVVDGKIAITEDIIGQFANQNRVFLQITGLTQGTSVTLVAEIEHAVRYDTTGGLRPVEVSASALAVPGGINVAVLSTPEGRTEAYHIDAPATFAAPSGNYQLFIGLPFDPNTINLSGVVGTGGVTGSAINPQGQLVLVFANQAQTDFAIPQSILDQIGEGDFSSVLVAVNVATGTSLSGTIDVREGIAIPEGVFVQTFDANGDPILPDLSLESVSSNDVLVGDFGNDVIIGSGAVVNVMTGSQGNDSFAFTQSAIGFNSVTDFEPGSDVIDLSGIDAVFGTPEDDVFQFLGTDGFTGAAGQARYDVTADGVTVSLDTNGDLLADYTINLLGLTVLDPEDLIL